MESYATDREEEVLYLPQDTEVYEIDGPFFFGVANKFDELMREIGSHHRIRIIRMRKVPLLMLPAEQPTDPLSQLTQGKDTCHPLGCQ